MASALESSLETSLANSLENVQNLQNLENQASDFWAQMGQWVLDFLPKLLAAAVIVVVGLFIGRILKKVCTKALEKANREVGMVSFISSAVSVIIKIFTAVIAISALGVDMSVIVGGLSAVGLGITLALKNNMANVASGLQMIFTKPFKVGDYIATDDGVEGTVERVELMFSVLRTFDNKEIVIPNAKLADNVVTNFSAMENRRMDLRFSVAYGDDLLHAKAVLYETVSKDKRILEDPPLFVGVDQCGDSAVQLLARLWCKTDDYWDLYYALQEAVKLAFDENGVHMPFPQMDVHVDQKP